MTRIDLHDVSEADLLAELERKKTIALASPKPLQNPDFSTLVITVTNGVAQAAHKQHEDADFKQYVYEAALKAVYGPDFFKWRNKQKY